MREIVKTDELADRLPEHGRLRMGIKTGSAMAAIEHWRFTSSDLAALERLAELYGGEPRPWSDPKARKQDQHELLSTSASIRVILPNGALSTWYEQWGGGGILRRCDGVTCQTPGREEMVEQPCICEVQQQRACKPYTRLNVVIPEVEFKGVWRLETKSWNAAHELPGMEQLISGVQSKGLLEATLGIEKRTTMKNGRKQHFVVPTLALAASLDQLVAGHGTVGVLAGPAGADLPALPSGPSSVTDETLPPVVDTDPDDTIIDAEIVEPDDYPREARQPRFTLNVSTIAKDLDLPVEAFEQAVCRTVSAGRTHLVGELTDGEHAKACSRLDEVVMGRKAIRLTDDGTIVLKAIR